MTHTEAFLADVIAHPDDDAPRLVYADWLEDHGEIDRAEFIRAQCARAKLPEDDPDAEPLRGREAQLLTANEARWNAALPAGACDAEYRRGFVERLRFRSLTSWPQIAGAWFAAAPVRDVELALRRATISAAQVDAVAACPWLGRLTALTIGLRDGQGWALPLLLASPYLANLTRLDLGADESVPLGVQVADVVSAASHLGGLKELELADNDIGPEGAEALAEAGHLGSLNRLGLAGNELGPDGAGSIAWSPHFAELTSLDLGICGVYERANRIDTEGLSYLLRSPHLTRLRSFDLNYNDLGDPDVRHLLAWPHLSLLRRLSLGYNGLTDRAVEHLAASPALTNLEWLDLAGIEALRAPSARALLGSPYLRRLRWLWLDRWADRSKLFDALEARFGDLG